MDFIRICPIRVKQDSVTSLEDMIGIRFGIYKRQHNSRPSYFVFKVNTLVYELWGQYTGRGLMLLLTFSIAASG